jgi:hypothetical protein
MFFFGGQLARIVYLDSRSVGNLFETLLLVPAKGAESVNAECSGVP